MECLRRKRMRIVIGSDHGGYELKKDLVSRFEKAGHSVTDTGCYTPEAVDYPDVAEKLCHRLLDEHYDFGILLCGTGIGVSIAANKIDGIRAAHLADEYSARMAKAHNDANVITLGARVLGPELAWSIVGAYMDSSFMHSHHEVRVEKIMALEKKN